MFPTARLEGRVADEYRHHRAGVIDVEREEVVHLDHHAATRSLGIRPALPFFLPVRRFYRLISSFSASAIACHGTYL